MPEQSLWRWQGGAIKLRRPGHRLSARIFVFSLTALLVTVGTVMIYKVISPVNITWLQLLFASLFALTFTWISFSCASACLGFLLILTREEKNPRLSPFEKMGRTALVMPLYNEEPSTVFDTLARIAQGLVRAGAGKSFDVFILSDTRKDDTAKVELMFFEALRHLLGKNMAVYYRRRGDNHHRKAGNIADFVIRWGGAYDHMVVLDADSDMNQAGNAVVLMASAGLNCL